MRSHSSVNARSLQISSTKRMPALTKNEIEPNTCGEPLRRRPGPSRARRRARRSPWPARRRSPAPASPPPPAGGTSTRSSGSTAARARRTRRSCRRSAGATARAGRCTCRGDRYSLTMSFCVVPRSSLAGDALLLGVGDVQREQPRRGGVDRHRRVHLAPAGCRRAACACGRGGRPARRPCRPRPGPSASRGRSRSGSAGRRRSTGRSGPWPGSCGRARWTPRPSSGPSRSASSTASARDGRHRVSVLRCRQPPVRTRRRQELGG